MNAIVAIGEDNANQRNALVIVNTAEHAQSIRKISKRAVLACQTTRARDVTFI